ncbi:MAG: hypothetical protein AAB642_01055, partial [Patescibacteria group bacterium]
MLITAYRDTDFKIFSEYIESAFYSGYILGHEKYLKWQYSDSLYLLKAGDQIVGHFGFRDIPYKVGQAVKDVRVLMNLFVLPQFRVLGGGAILSGRVFDTPNAIMVSGYTPAVHQVCMHLIKGWKAVGNLSRFIAILNPQNSLVAGYKLPRFGFKRQPSLGFSVSASTGEPGILEQVWLKARLRYGLTVERTRSYIKWRFFDNPLIKYSVFVCYQGGSACGYLIGRTESDAGFKIARIIDLVSVEAADQHLVRSFVSWARRRGCDAADFMFSGGWYRDSLERSGFFDVSGTDFRDFPILFSPISSKKTYINLAHNLGLSLDECYFTKADGDQDRPNPH